MRDKAVLAWLLWPVLLAEAVLTLPWLWRTAPFTDEALYLRAGHQEWSHWLHHAALPDYAGWFSGAPVLYPPLGAAADSIGGRAQAGMVACCDRSRAGCRLPDAGGSGLRHRCKSDDRIPRH